jgi:hypothetical protein
METRKIKGFWSGTQFRKVYNFLSLAFILTFTVALSVKAQTFKDLDKSFNDYSRQISHLPNPAMKSASIRQMIS